MVVEEDDEGVVDDVVNEVECLCEIFEKLEFCCMFSGEMDLNNVYLDIQVGFGGIEVQDWVNMLLCMYLCWVDKYGFDVIIIELFEGEVVGIKGVIVYIKGEYVFGWLCIEIGVYCLVCKSLFDFGNCCYILFIVVFVLLEIDDNIEIEINLVDLCIDIYCFFGVGGQYVNIIDLVVWIIYVLINIVVVCQNECFQYVNKDIVMKMLWVKLYELEMQKCIVVFQVLEDFKFDIGWGYQICFYVFDQLWIKDLCIGIECSDCDKVFDGDLDEYFEVSFKQGL